MQLDNWVALYIFYAPLPTIFLSDSIFSVERPPELDNRGSADRIRPVKVEAGIKPLGSDIWSRLSKPVWESDLGRSVMSGVESSGRLGPCCLDNVGNSVMTEH